MPVQQPAKTGFLAKHGEKLLKAQAANRGRAPEVGSPQVPAGIEGGIARLVECKMDVHKDGPNKGQPFFIMAGIVEHPQKFNGQKVAGLRTSQVAEPMYETPSRKRKTWEDHYAWMRDQLYSLGFDIDNLKGTPEQIDQQIMTGMVAMKGDPKNPATWIHFHFRTWKGNNTVIEERAGKWYAVTGNQTKGPYASQEMAQKQNPYAGKEAMVNHEWNGRCEFVNEAPDGGDVEDGTIREKATVASAGTTNQYAPPNGTTKPTTSVKPAPKRVVPNVVQEDPTPEPAADEVQPTVTELGDDPDSTLNDLAEAADMGDQGCRASLQLFALQHGLTQEFVDESNNWGEVSEAIKSAIAESEAAADQPSNGEVAPEVGHTFKHRPVNRITNKPAAKVVDCEVTKVDSEARTFDLLSLVDRKTVYKSVSWDDVES